jgi:hypothetical protein
VDNNSLQDTTSQPLEEDGSGQRLVWFLLGIAALGCGLLFVLAFLFFQPDAQSLMDQYFPSATATPSPTSTPTQTLTPTATITSTPHVLITPAQRETIFNETFDTNDRRWYGYYTDSQVAVENGKLRLRSEQSGHVALTICSLCLSLNDAFYYQAEVSTLADTDEFYGLGICSPGFGPDFYVFQISPRARQYELQKHAATGWETLITTQYVPLLNDFPVTNILGLYFDHGQMELYINDVHVISYQDKKPMDCRRAGFYVNDAGFDMIVDNVFWYSVESRLTPTP